MGIIICSMKSINVTVDGRVVQCPMFSTLEEILEKAGLIDDIFVITTLVGVLVKKISSCIICFRR